MRLFIAVPVAESVREHVGALVEDLRKSGANCKWVERQNLHVTMSFLGDIAEEKLPAIERVLQEAAAGRAAFPMAFGGAGTFDSPRGPRIVWLGMSQGAKEMAALGEALAAALRKAGFKVEDRPFHPHITLGRLRGQKNVLKLTERLRSGGAVSSPVCEADCLVLFHSKLGNSGPTYSALKEQPLRA